MYKWVNPLQARLLKGAFYRVTETNEDRAYEVEFLNCVVDKEDNFKIVDSDSHFSEFAGVHPSKIKEGKLFLQDIVIPSDRQEVIEKICKKDSPYIYMDMDLLNSDDEPIYVHCTAQNIENSSLCRLVFADVSKSREKNRKLKEKAREINHLIDLVTGGVCLFKVTPNMHFETLYVNEGACRLLGTTKDKCQKQVFRLDEFIHPEDKTLVFQAVGKCMATGEPMDLEYRIRQHKNKYIWCTCDAAVHRIDDDGSPIFHAMFTDISRVKEAEARADEANDKLVNLLENLSGAIFFTTPEKPFECDLISGDFVKLTGYSRNEFFERFDGNLSKIIVGYSDELKENIRREILKKGECESTYQISAKGHNTKFVKDVRKLITQQDGSMAIICELEEINQ